MSPSSKCEEVSDNCGTSALLSVRGAFGSRRRRSGRHSSASLPTQRTSRVVNPGHLYLPNLGKTRGLLLLSKVHVRLKFRGQNVSRQEHDSDLGRPCHHCENMCHMVMHEITDTCVINGRTGLRTLP
eukprot:4374521-Pleurochrysis_carterae.AAC.1